MKPNCLVSINPLGNRPVGSWALVFLGLGLLAGATAEEKAVNVRKIGPGDAITVTVFREPVLTGQFTVNEQGAINFPLIGTVQASGQTQEEVAKEIEQLLEKDYVRDAQVSVNVTGKGAMQISVLGEVRAPGRFPFGAEERVELATALLVAGGPTANSNLNTIELTRRNGEDIESRRLTMPDDKGFVLQKDDSLISAPLVAVGAARPIITVLGQVARPGSYELQGGERIDLLEAIGLAGGFTRIANRGRVLIQRRDGEAVTTIKANAKRMADGKEAPIEVQPGDVITVSESWF